MRSKIMKIDNKTKLYVSVSSNPGNTGSRLHNTCFKLLKVNAIYVPFKCNSIKEVLALIKSDKIFGISVSMPFKKKVYKYLNKVDKYSKLAKTVNTIVKKGKITIGYNTDIIAIKKILKKINFRLIKTIVILGNGAMAETIYNFLKKKYKNKIILCSRSLKKYSKWKIRKNDIKINWKKRNNISGNLLINSTPIGMRGFKDETLFSKKQLVKFKFIIDLPVSKKNKLMTSAKKNRIQYFSGKEISFYQGVEQSKMYTNKILNENLIKRKLNYANDF